MSIGFLVIVFPLTMMLGAVSAQQAPAPGSSPASLRQQLQAKFEELHEAGSFPGGTAGFVLQDGTAFGLAVGVSDRASGTAMKASDRLLLGSVGKTYASAVALQLVHEGTIALEDPISKYLGGELWFKRLSGADRVTIRQLMTHTSGLVRYEFLPDRRHVLPAIEDRCRRSGEFERPAVDRSPALEIPDGVCRDRCPPLIRALTDRVRPCFVL